MKTLRSFLLPVWLWVWPATLAGAVVAALVAIPSLAWQWPWFVWLPIAPSLYVCWLILFLSLCGMSMRGLETAHPKPRYAVLPGGGAKVSSAALGSARLQLVSSLPLGALLQQSAWGRKLVMRAYSASVHIGEGVQIAGRLADPDLTEVGDHAVIGAGALIAAHAWTALPNGKLVYVTAPVKIGARANVGAGTLVAYGCVIGEDSLVEPMSYLPPFTEVPAGEVWGGRPASFQQTRTRLRKIGAAADPAG
jgi:carbonic anhydrase/acetyltransferase-like protein (isoleucine patch superfamily)